MGKKWSPEKIIEFLELYEQHTCLWDVHSSSYKNRYARDDAYLKMAKMMEIEGFNSADVKAKIRSIRNAYTLELCKIAKSKKSGTGVGGIYKPKVAWFTVADRILHEVVQIRESQSTEIDIEDSKLLKSNSLDVTSSSNTQSTSTINKQTNKPFTPSSSNTPRVTTSKTAPKRFKKTEQLNTEKPLEELRFISQATNQPPPVENEFDCFGKSVVCHLKKLPEYLALESMAYIQSYLVEQRLKSSQPTAACSCSCK